MASATLSLLWEMRGRRIFAKEVLAAAGVADDVRRSGLRAISDQYLEVADWAELFRNATEIDLLSSWGATWRRRYESEWNQWIERPNVRLRVLLPDPTGLPGGRGRRGRPGSRARRRRRPASRRGCRATRRARGRADCGTRTGGYQKGLDALSQRRGGASCATCNDGHERAGPRTAKRSASIGATPSVLIGHLRAAGLWCFATVGAQRTEAAVRGLHRVPRVFPNSRAERDLVGDRTAGFGSS